MRIAYGFKLDGGKIVPDEVEQKALGLIRELRTTGLSRSRIISLLVAEGGKRDFATFMVREVYQPSAIAHLHAVGVRLSEVCANEDGFDVERVFADAITAECAEVIRLLETRDE